MADASVSRVRRPATEIAAILAALEGSGLSQRAFCKERGISVSSLSLWLRKHRMVTRSEPRAGAALSDRRLIPVHVVGGRTPRGNAEPAILELVLENDRTVRVLATATVEHIRTLLAAIEQL